MSETLSLGARGVAAARLQRLLRDACSAGPLSAATKRWLRSYALAKLRGLRDVAQALGQPDDREELFGTVAAAWLELRFEWERHNRVANYQLAFTGHAEPRIVASAALCSGLLAWLEDAIPASVRERFSTMTVSLLESVRADVATGRVDPVDAAAIAAAADVCDPTLAPRRLVA